MIARTWHGATTLDDADRYLALMRTVGLPGYHAIAGNRGAYVLHHVDGELAHFTMLSFWDTWEAIRAFAGDDPEVAVYYDFDPDLLVEMEPTVTHHLVYDR